MEINQDIVKRFKFDLEIGIFKSVSHYWYEPRTKKYIFRILTYKELKNFKRFLNNCGFIFGGYMMNHIDFVPYIIVYEDKITGKIYQYLDPETIIICGEHNDVNEIPDYVEEYMKNGDL